MGDDTTPALLKADVGRAADNLHKLILSAETATKIALARAVFLYKDTRYSIPQSRQALIGKKAATTVLQNVQNDAVSFAKEAVSWDTATSGNGKAHATRRKQYEDYLDLITKQFELFHPAYQKLAPSVPIPPFPKSSMTSEYLTMLRIQLLAWYDSKPSSKSIPDPNPLDGVARFMNEHREALILLKTTHTDAKQMVNRDMAIKACKLQLALAPVLSPVIGLYKYWDGPRTFSFKSPTELDRAVLALGFLVLSFGRLLKSGRPVYQPDRLYLIYGGLPSSWGTALGYCSALFVHRDWQHLLDNLYYTVGPSKTLTGAETILAIVDAESDPSFVTAAPEWWLADLWKDLKFGHPWLSTAQLDEWAIRRVLLMGTNLSHILCQLLAELAETRIAAFLRHKSGVYALGLADPPDGCTLEFVPGHVFRAGDKILDFVNRQLTDGVIGYWDKDGFHVVGVLEAKVDGLGGRELGHAKTTTAGLLPDEMLQLRRFAKRESAEDRDVANRNETVFKTPIEQYERQILKFETGSQVSRDINRLDILDQVRINGVLARLPRLQDSPLFVKIFAVVPNNTEPTALEKEVQVLNAQPQSQFQSQFQFEPLAVPPTATELKALADAISLKAKALFPPSTAWPNLDSELVLPRIEKLYQEPHLLQQGNLGLCTAAVFLFHMFTLKPVETAQFAQDLYIGAIAKLGKLEVHPGANVRQADYQAIFLNKNLRFAPDQADWMLMCGLRDSENWWIPVEGEPSDFFSIATDAKEMSKWYTKTEFFTSIKYDEYHYTDPSVEALEALVKTNKNAIVLGIKTKMLRSHWAVSFSILPDGHMVPMTSTPVIDRAMNKIEFEYWTWGQKPRLLKEELDFVRDCILEIFVVTI